MNIFTGRSLDCPVAVHFVIVIFASVSGVRIKIFDMIRCSQVTTTSYKIQADGKLLNYYCYYDFFLIVSKSSIWLKALDWNKKTGFEVTCCMLSQETLFLNGRVALENHKHLISGGQNRMWFFVTAKTPKCLAVWWIAIVYVNVIVSALLMWLHVEYLEQLKGDVKINKL